MTEDQTVALVYVLLHTAKTRGDYLILILLGSQTQTSVSFGRIYCHLGISLLLLLYILCVLYICTLCNCRNKWDLEERDHNPFIFLSGTAQHNYSST